MRMPKREDVGTATGTVAQTSTGISGLNHLASAEVTAVRPVLMIFDQNRMHEWHMLVGKKTLIGRDAEVDITVRDDTASRKHIQIDFENIDHPSEPPRCVLSDFESRNGTFLNGQRLEKPTVLHNGDRVFIGSTCIAYFLRTELEVNSDRKLRALATKDGLTGLLNRGYMAIQFQKEHDRSKRYNRPLALLMTDIDDFKKINDTYGHPVGDDVLKQLAQIVIEKARAHDISGRYGGEEFAILLPETPGDGAAVFAERLRKSVNDSRFKTAGPVLSISVSVGVAAMPAGGKESIDDLIRMADEALYDAKKAGKNRVCVYGGE